MKHPILLLGIVGLALGLSTASQAWNGPGHEQIADIAWSQLDGNTKMAVRALLKAGDPHFRPSGDSDAAVRSAFRKAATFPDYIKRNGDPGYDPTIYENDIDNKLNPLFDPAHDPEVSSSEKKRCKSWHYLDTPLFWQGHLPQEPARAKSNALAALTHSLNQLDQAPTPRDKCLYLYWIEHLVGDLHQPLHCASSFKTHAKGDAGGNLFELGIPDPRDPSEGMKLHSYWDAGIDHAKAADRKLHLSTAMMTVTDRWSTTPELVPSIADRQNTDVASWIKAGANLAETRVYAGIDEADEPSDAYETAHVEVCKKQAVLAGFRLAHLLNQHLGH